MPLTPSEKDYLESAAEGWENSADSNAANAQDALKREYIAKGVRLALRLLEQYR